jgi:prepilin-type N-terminal cleavage/methylation domain-containing protein
MKKSSKISFLSDERGYTLIEVLVALCILFIVLIPVTQIISYLLSTQNNRDKIHAINLAEKEMELCITRQDFTSEEYSVSAGARSYLITRKVEKKTENLYFIEVEVRRSDHAKSIVRLYTFQLIE